jgi:hypothetical protein
MLNKGLILIMISAGIFGGIVNYCIRFDRENDSLDFWEIGRLSVIYNVHACQDTNFEILR